MPDKTTSASIGFWGRTLWARTVVGLAAVVGSVALIFNPPSADTSREGMTALEAVSAALAEDEDRFSAVVHQQARFFPVDDVMAPLTLETAEFALSDCAPLRTARSGDTVAVALHCPNGVRGIDMQVFEGRVVYVTAVDSGRPVAPVIRQALRLLGS